MPAPTQPPRKRALLASALGAIALASCRPHAAPARVGEDASAAAVDTAADAKPAEVQDAGARARLPGPPPSPSTGDGRDLESDPPPGARSTRPTDWSHAVPVLAHGSHGCEATLEREWIKISYPDSASVTLIGGAAEGVVLGVQESAPEGDAGDNFGRPERHPKATAIFPLRRGDRRVLQFNGFKQGFISYNGGEPDDQAAGLTLSELWLEGDTGPRVEID